MLRPARACGVPYTTEWPTSPSLGVRLQRELEELTYAALEAGLRLLRGARWRRGDPAIDEYLIELIGARAFGFGF